MVWWYATIPYTQEARIEEELIHGKFYSGIDIAESATLAPMTRSFLLKKSLYPHGLRATML